MDIFVQLISNVGFPIACCIAMFYMMQKQGDRHAEEMNKLALAIDNNTDVMQSVLQRLEREEVKKNGK